MQRLRDKWHSRYAASEFRRILSVAITGIGQRDREMSGHRRKVKISVVIRDADSIDCEAAQSMFTDLELAGDFLAVVAFDVDNAAHNGLAISIQQPTSQSRPPFQIEFGPLVSPIQNHTSQDRALV